MVELKPKQHIKRMRSGMIILSWIMAMLLLVYFFGYVLKRQQNPNMHPKSMLSASGIKEVSLRANNAHSYYVNGKINGHSVTFLLDTGATNVAIPEGLNSQLKLPKGAQVLVSTANGRAIAYQTRIRSLRIGNIVLSNVRASLNPAFRANYVLLGMNALKQLEFIHRGNTLTLRQYPN